MRVKRYLPGFFSGFEDEYAEFATKDEMLAVPWVARWKDSKGFIGFFVDREEEWCRKVFSVRESSRALMAVMRSDENDNGLAWYVVFLSCDPEVKDALVMWLPEIDFSKPAESVTEAFPDWRGK